MKNYLIAERYAKALCSALEDAELDRMCDMLEAAADLYESSEALRNVLNSPAIDLDKRREVLQQVLAGAEIEKQVQRLVEVLLARGRIAILPDVATVFRMLADVRLNRIRATVSTATETTPEQEGRLAQALQAWSGKEVRIKREVNPDILGGVVAQMGDAVIDGSVRTRIERLREYALEYDIRTHDAH